MSTQYKKKVEEYCSQLRETETVEQIALFNAIPIMLAFFAAAIALFLVGRMFLQYVVVLLGTNLLSMWMMVDAAQALHITQNSCIIVTDQRVFGQAGGRKVDLAYPQIKNVVLGRLLFLDGGDARSSVAIRYATNKKELYQAILKHCPDIRNQ